MAWPQPIDLDLKAANDNRALAVEQDVRAIMEQVSGAIAAARTERSGIDLLLGIGGTPEGVIGASALKCLGGAMQGRLYPRNDEERGKLLDAGFDLEAVLSTDDLVSGNDVFFAATGITTGSLLRGVEYTVGGAVVASG